MRRVEGAERLETWADASTDQHTPVSRRDRWLQSIDPQRFRPRQVESPGPITIRGGKGEVGQRALRLARRVKEKEGWVVKRLIIQLSSRIFSAEGLPSGFLQLAGRPANQSLNSVELWSDANMHYLPTLELIKK